MGSIGEAEEVWEALEQVYMPAADIGELPIRVFAMVPLATWYCPSASPLQIGMMHLVLLCDSSPTIDCFPFLHFPVMATR